LWIAERSGNGALVVEHHCQEGERERGRERGEKESEREKRERRDIAVG
jgi:hypothetical protein